MKNEILIAFVLGFLAFSLSYAYLSSNKKMNTIVADEERYWAEQLFPNKRYTPLNNFPDGKTAVYFNTIFGFHHAVTEEGVDVYFYYDFDFNAYVLYAPSSEGVYTYVIFIGDNPHFPVLVSALAGTVVVLVYVVAVFSYKIFSIRWNSEKSLRDTSSS